MRPVGPGKLNDLLSDLASPSPAPGGGAAAGVTAALGVALAEMTAAINARRAKKTFPKSNDLSGLRSRCLKAVERDARAFAAVDRLRGADRAGARYQSALRKAAEAPASMVALCERAIGACVREAPRTSRWLASDLIEASLLLRAAAQAARLNVDINLGMIRDARYVRSMRSRMDASARRIAAAEAKVRKGVPR